MSLLNRKPRPLKRDPDQLRDTRLFVIGCCDTYAPKQCFEFFRWNRVKVVVSASEDGSGAEKALDRVKQYEADERWLVLDVDHRLKAEHQRGLAWVVQEARQAKIQVAFSKPSFEIWLLLHYAEEAAVIGLQDATQVETTLRAALGEYNKTNLKPEHYPIQLAHEAAARARNLDATVQGNDIPQANTTRIYQLWDAITDWIR